MGALASACVSIGFDDHRLCRHPRRALAPRRRCGRPRRRSCAGRGKRGYHRRAARSSIRAPRRRGNDGPVHGWVGGPARRFDVLAATPLAAVEQGVVAVSRTSAQGSTAQPSARSASQRALPSGGVVTSSQDVGRGAPRRGRGGLRLGEPDRRRRRPCRRVNGLDRRAERVGERGEQCRDRPRGRSSGRPRRPGSPAPREGTRLACSPGCPRTP